MLQAHSEAVREAIEQLVGVLLRDRDKIGISSVLAPTFSSA